MVNDNPQDFRQPGADAVDLAARAAALLEQARELASANPKDTAAARAVADAAKRAANVERDTRVLADRRYPIPVSEIKADWPLTLLRATGLNGALLTAGEVLVIAGDGGIGKTTLLISALLGVAGRWCAELGPLPGGVFDGVGGPVLYAAHEDRPSVQGSIVRWAAAARYADGGEWVDEGIEGRRREREEARQEALQRFHILPMRSRRLYGPRARPGGGAGLYTARPEPLEGWGDLWEAADKIGPVVIVVDPVLSAYAGNSNEAAPVREFLDTMRAEAEALNAGLIIVAHSAKDARRTRDSVTVDPFDTGQIGGSGAWVDAPRGVLSMIRTPLDGDSRTLAIFKANYGPSFRVLDMNPRHRYQGRTGALIGFEAGGEGWIPESQWRAKVNKAKAAANNAQKGKDKRKVYDYAA